MSSPWAATLLPAALAAAVVVVAWLLARLLLGIRREAREARHTAAAIAEREAENYSGLLRAAGDPPWEDASGWHWAQHSPHPVRVEILTGPGTGIGELARGTGQFPMLPATGSPQPPPADTCEIPIVNQVYGIPSDNEQYVDDLLAKYAPKPEFLP